MSPMAALSALSLLKWPLTIAGAALFFGLSTEGTLSLVASNADKLTKPIGAKPSFNLPPVRQIGEIKPLAVAPKARLDDGGSGIPTWMAGTALGTTLPQQFKNDNVPTDTTSARVGKSSVNVRAAPLKGSDKLGVLGAGTPVRIGEAKGGWLRVWYDGGTGWVYSSYLEGVAASSAVSITVSGGNTNEAPTSEPNKVGQGEVVQAGSRLVVRDAPRSSASSVFRLERGERFKVVARKGNWIQIATATGEGGWIKAK
jgi:SH3-like domain-containing protein